MVGSILMESRNYNEGKWSSSFPSSQPPVTILNKFNFNLCEFPELFPCSFSTCLCYVCVFQIILTLFVRFVDLGFTA